MCVIDRRFSFRLRQALVKLLEHERPRLVVPVPRLLVRKPRVREPQMRPRSVRREFDGDNRFGSLRSLRSGNPRHLDETIALEPQEAPVMGMALRFALPSGL